MLSRVTRMHRVDGGQDATPTEPGSCGGGEYNRLILSVDPTLHAALVSIELADIPAGAGWRASSDAAGPHDPFDASDETEDGAPRGQAHFFADPTSAAATAPLGRQDLEGLVDPYAFEIDHDFDCAHQSNPLCDYTFYGPACSPQPTAAGVEIYAGNYGDFDPGWAPAGCAP